MGMNWLSRSVSFAESIAIGPKTCWSQRAYASLKIDVYHSTGMIATVGVHGGVTQFVVEATGIEPAQDFNP
jgi:hypothetical protein